MLGKWYKDLQGFKWAEVTPEDEKQVQEILRKKNIEIMTECLSDAWKFLNLGDRNKDTTDLAIAQLHIAITVAFFEKRATQAYTAEMAFLEDKIQMLKQKDNPRPMTQGEIKTLGGEDAAKTIEEAGKP